MIRVIGFAVLMPLIFGNIVNIARLSLLSNIHPNRDSFMTMYVTGLNDCGKLCKSITSCVLVNYRYRGHVCNLEHHIGTTRISIRGQRKSGYVSWRNELFHTFNGVATQCPICERTESCEVKSGSDDCEPFACGKPYTYGNMNMWGNINTRGGKFSYGCFNHAEESSYSQFFQCSQSGAWFGLDDVCGYEDYEIDGEPFKLKIVNKRVSKSEAMKRCGYEGANLTNILTRKKLSFFRRISNKLPGDFWIDMDRVGANLTLWTSSDGNVHEIDQSLWANFSTISNHEYCARSNRKRNWKINDFRCWKPFY